MTNPTTREKVYEALDIERSNQKFLEQGDPDIDDEIKTIEFIVKQAKEQKTYNQKLDKLREATGIAIRCFENFGIQPKPILKKPKRIIFR